MKSTSFRNKMNEGKENAHQNIVQTENSKDLIRKKFRLLELYSGIGGMRFSLDAIGIPYEVVAAIDVNPIVNKIYQYNFGSQGHSQKNILSFTTDDIENMKLDIITMSPPCQPFTRVGLQKDIEDARSSSFLHILNILRLLKRKPSYILLENVQGFENSQARDALIETIENSGYIHQEFLLTPQYCGIPNSRLRYYIIAKLRSEQFSFMKTQEILLEIPNISNCWKYPCTKCVQAKTNEDEACPLKHFLEDKSDEYFESYLIPDDVLLKYWSVFDIVTDNSCNSCCFTKAYHRYAQGTGSVILAVKEAEADDIFDRVRKSEDTQVQLTLLKKLKLRYFTPKEIANIMCFPNSFGFPSSVTVRQMYKSLGNSLNVFVVSCLMKLMLDKPD